MGEININVRVPATDRQFLIVLPKDTKVRHMFDVIDHYHRKLFQTSVKVQFVRNDQGSVVDSDLHVERVFSDNDLVEACCASVVDAYAGIPDDARASEKRAAEELDAVSEASGKRAKKAKKIRDPNAPRRPVNAFLHFVASRRVAGDTGEKGKEFMQLLGQEWKQMTDAQKAPYVKLKDDQKAEYDAKMKEIANGDVVGVVEEAVPTVVGEGDKDEDVNLSAQERKTLKKVQAKHESLKGKDRIDKIKSSFNKEMGTKYKTKWIKAALKSIAE